MDGLVRQFLPGLDPSRHARVCRWMEVLADATRWEKPALLVDGQTAFLLKKVQQLRWLLEAVNHKHNCCLRSVPSHILHQETLERGQIL